MRALGELFAVDADFVSVTAAWWKGRAAIEKNHAFLHGVVEPTDTAGVSGSTLKNFGAFRHTTLTFDSIEVRLVGPSSAVARAAWRITGDARTEMVRKGLFLFVVRQTRKAWHIVAAQNTEANRPSELVASPGLRGGTAGRCVPLSERAGREFGCFVLAHEPLGALGEAPVFWYVDRFPDRTRADAAKGPRGTVVESLGRVWLLTIERAGWHAMSGERMAAIGPLPVDSRTEYSAQYMEATFRPGMKSTVHRHGGPEAWYTLTGETCLETPSSTFVGRRGGVNVVVPHGPPMELTATGTETRRALVLILHDALLPATTEATDWNPKGLCEQSPPN